MNPNQQQIEALLRIVLAAGGPVAGLLVNWGVPSGQVNNWLTLGLMILPPAIAGLWSLIRNTEAARVLSAKAVPGAEVVVDPAKASEPVKALANDPAVAGVNLKGNP